MLLWITIALFVIGIIVAIIGDNMYTNSDLDEVVQSSGIGISVLAGIALFVMCIILCINYIGIEADVEQHKVQYEALQYKVTSGACRDEFGLLSKEVIDEAQAWNEEMTKGKMLQHNFWVGVFVPNVYDQFELIDYTTYNTGGVKQ